MACELDLIPVHLSQRFQGKSPKSSKFWMVRRNGKFLFIRLFVTTEKFDRADDASAALDTVGRDSRANMNE
jgi:hypothetical protein